MQLSPAAQPKLIEGVCRRRNIKCGWKKIDFVLRMVRKENAPGCAACASLLTGTFVWGTCLARAAEQLLHSRHACFL